MEDPGSPISASGVRGPNNSPSFARRVPQIRPGTPICSAECPCDTPEIGGFPFDVFFEHPNVGACGCYCFPCSSRHVFSSCTSGWRVLLLRKDELSNDVKTLGRHRGQTGFHKLNSLQEGWDAYKTQIHLCNIPHFRVPMLGHFGPKF